MAPAPCPHGLDPGRCEICRVLAPEPARPPSMSGSRRPSPARRGAGARLATVAVVALVGFVVLTWVAAAVWAALRLVQVLVVAAVAGWIGWSLGVRRGRHRSN